MSDEQRKKERISDCKHLLEAIFYVIQSKGMDPVAWARYKPEESAKLIIERSDKALKEEDEGR